MSIRHQLSALAAVFALSAVGCGVPGANSPSDGPPDEPTTSADSTTAAVDEAGNEPKFDCPVTIPSQPNLLRAQDPWPAEYPHDGMVWYGTDDLWTALALDGDHGVRRSVWWSANFPGGTVEEKPKVSVAWTRLDATEETVVDNGGKATNAFTPEEGWFMIAGIDPPEPGCWDVTAAYKGATLSYVYDTRG